MNQPVQTPHTDAPPPAASPRSRAEWITFGMASFVLAIVVGLVAYTWLDEQQPQPPLISVTKTEKTRAANGQFYVPFTVTNNGGQTTESVSIVAELRVDGTIVETGHLEVDFLSKREEAEGAFVFSRDPEQGHLTLRVTSYKLP